MLKFETTALRVVYMPGQHPEARFQSEYQQTFEVWKDVWKKYFETLPEPKPFSSDSFTRQDEVVGIFYKDKCVGAACARWFDANLIDCGHDSYFRIWGPQELKQLKAHGSMICIPSSLTVHRDFRRDKCEFDIGRLIMSLTCKRMLASPHTDVLALTTRNAKGVNDVFYSLGGIPLRTEIVNFHAQDLVDLVAVYRKNVRLPEDVSFRSVLERVWEARSVAAQDRVYKTLDSTHSRAA